MLLRTLPHAALTAVLVFGAGCGGQTRDGATSNDAGAPGRDSALAQDAPAESLGDTGSDVTLDGARDASAEATTPLDAMTDVEGVPDAPPDAQSDAGSCVAVCATGNDCQLSCPPAFETAYCCDINTKQCFVGTDGLNCPLHTNPLDAGLQGCLVSGCGPGEMCVTYDSPDPPELPVPSCFALPAACAGDPTCPCLLEAGVCSGAIVPSACDGVDGAAITCFL